MVKRSRPKGEGGGVFKVYDEPESPHEERSLFKIHYDEREAP